MIQTQATVEQLQEQLLARTARDDAFRQELIRRPVPVLERELGIKIGKGVEVQVVEETPEKIVLVLPMRSGAARELSEEQLGAIAGGFTPIPLPIPVGFLRLWTPPRERRSSSSPDPAITPINLP